MKKSVIIITIVFAIIAMIYIFSPIKKGEMFICDNCESKIEVGDAYCSNCGSEIDEVVERKSMPPIRIAVVIAAVVIVILAAVQLIGKMITEDADWGSPAIDIAQVVCAGIALVCCLIELIVVL